MSSTLSSAYALIDGNNFYVSCERLFNPRLEARPVIVMSNNDGMVISRSAEVKALGVPMGAPMHKIRDVIRRHGIVSLSSNYSLYGDLSQRMMAVAGQFAPVQEIYSIDESFLDFSDLRGRDLVAHSQAVRSRVRQWVGIPTCVGIGATRTLAKLANHVAKKRPQFDGVCDFTRMDSLELVSLLGGFAATDVWGVGRRWGARLETLGIRTARDLLLADAVSIRAQFGVVVERTISELRGVGCQPLEAVAPDKKQILSSRSFGRLTGDVEELAESVTMHVSAAAEKLRRQASACTTLQVFLKTNPFKPELPQYNPVSTVKLGAPTDDSLKLVSAAVRAMRAIYKPGYLYQKSGVILIDLQPKALHQPDLFEEAPGLASAGISARERLMLTLDTVNRRAGRGTMRFASEGVDHRWRMRREKMSPAYTTRWEDLPVARA
jgi:DNA polymerase V